MKAVVNEFLGKIHCGDALTLVVKNAFVQAGSCKRQMKGIFEFGANIVGVKHSRLRRFANAFGSECADVGISA